MLRSTAATMTRPLRNATLVFPARFRSRTAGFFTRATNPGSGTGTGEDSPAATTPESTTASTNDTATPSTSPPTTTPTPESEHQQQIVSLQTQLKEMKDNYLRSLAAQENLRERTRKEKEMAQQLAIKGFALDVTSVADVLDLALESVPVELRQDKENHPHLANLYQGLAMTRTELLACFKRHGVLVAEPQIGDTFDPNLHQAMFQAPAPSPDHAPGTILAVTKKGYSLHGVIIRAPQVGVVLQP